MGAAETASRTRNEHLTFRANRDAGRHGWLRLTPAYSHRLVAEALERCGRQRPVVCDPFSGSGTTGLVAAEQGHDAHLVDVNPFLVWFAAAKTRNYRPDELAEVAEVAAHIVRQGPGVDAAELWQPPLHRIERWWRPEELAALKALRYLIDETDLPPPGTDLLLVALCRTLIAVSDAAFDHQSMSFASRDSGGDGAPARTWARWEDDVGAVLAGAATPLPGRVAAHLGDARALEEDLPRCVDVLFTSPPYANRMSYVRELRPYMYWLRYLTEPRDAGELDWTAIGGTWGVATSRVGSWEPTQELPLDGELAEVCERIRDSGGRNAELLARYVHKYTDDMWRHFRSAAGILNPGGRAIYVVGNSSFFGEVVPVQEWYAQLLVEAGFRDVSVTVIRKRNSNRALFEYAVEATRP